MPYIFFKQPVEIHAYPRRIGSIMISLKQEVKEGEKDLTESPHNTAVTGNAVEKYTLTVSYRPSGANISNWHTGSYGSGMSDGRAGYILKENTHIINVYVKGLQITKVNLNDRILKGLNLLFIARQGTVKQTILKSMEDNIIRQQNLTPVLPALR